MSANKVLFRGAIPTTVGVAEYTAPTGYIAIIKEIRICNTTAQEPTFSIHFVPVGGTADVTNAVVYGKKILANEPYDLDKEYVLNAGDFIQITASISGLSMTGIGEEVRIQG